MNEDEERHADEVNIAFQMGAEWERKQSKVRIEQLEKALQKIADIKDGNIWGPEDVWVCLDRSVAVAEAALGEKADGQDH